MAALTLFTEDAAPVEFTVAEPGLAVAEAVLATWVGQTLVAKLSSPPRLTPGEIQKVKIKQQSLVSYKH